MWALIVCVLVIYPNTLWLAQEWFKKTVVNTRRSPKAMVVERAAETIWSPKNLLLGTGLGQFSSRAALLASDEYLSVDLPDSLSGQSGYFRKEVRPLIQLFEEIGEGSAVSKPYMSAVSLPVELGLPVFVALAIAIGVAARRNLLLMWIDDGIAGRIGMLSLVGIVFFVLCCFIENYAESAQAIFLPFLLYIAASSMLHSNSREMKFHSEIR